MAKGKASQAKTELVNIRLPDPAGGAQGEELPFRLAVIGDFTGKDDETEIEKRKKYSVNKKNFNQVMKKMDLSASFSVASRLSGKPDEEIPVDLKFDSLDSFRPEKVASQIPQINKLVNLRKDLKNLRAAALRDPKKLKELDALVNDVLSKFKGRQ